VAGTENDYALCYTFHRNLHSLQDMSKAVTVNDLFVGEGRKTNPVALRASRLGERRAIGEDSTVRVQTPLELTGSVRNVENKTRVSLNRRTY
jgi:hypothetical protein